MLNLLIVDDESTVRNGIRHGVNWQALDCRVIGEAANGQEGLEQARILRPDVIITDVRMPKLDGIGMLSQLRQEGNQVDVILLTAYSDFDYVRSALQLGAVDYLLKPFRDQELAAAIDRVRQRRQEKPAASPQIAMEVASGKKSKYVLRATDYIARNFADADLSITTIAGELGVSEGHLSHIFKKETGFTVIAYLTRFRMQTASKLLATGNYKIYEVAEKVGYRDVAYFSSTFKKLTGVSPSEYQEQNHNW